MNDETPTPSPEPSTGKTAYEERRKQGKQTDGKKRFGKLKEWAKLSLFIAIAVSGAGLGLRLFLASGIGDFSVTSTCITGETYHVHAKLRIVINGEGQEIPANLGTAPCVHPIHTHDDTGTIHLENAKPFTALLSDFFLIWGKPFSQNQILDYIADETHEITFTIDGEHSDQYENLVLADAQDIVIEYKAKE